MSIEIVFSSALLYMLVFTRLIGMFALNPLFGRINLPSTVRIGLVFFLTLLLAPLQSLETIENMGNTPFVFALLRELCIGAVYGYVFQIFYHFLFFVGSLMDTDFGLSMAQTFDPASNIQVSFSSSLLTLLFALYIFATGSHLAMIKLYATSFTTIPIGGSVFTIDLLGFILQLFTDVFLLALRLIAPFMVAQFILQASMGILMKFVPQITIFVINFQLRILLGVVMLFLFAPFIGQFIDNYITVMFDNFKVVGELMAG